jgi:hypothetical protein
MRKPIYDSRAGAAASATARLWIVAGICAFQYWLLTSSMEAWHGGNDRIALPAFIVSVVCFLLAAGLIVTGEIGTLKLRKDIHQNDSVPEDSKVIR